MVSVIEEIDPVTSSTALTAHISVPPPPLTDEISTTASPISSSLSSFSSHSTLSSLPISSSLTSGAASKPPPLPSPANVSSTIELIHHLLTSLHLPPQEIPTLLSKSPPLSSFNHQSAASSATISGTPASLTTSRDIPSVLPHHPHSRQPPLLQNPNFLLPAAAYPTAPPLGVDPSLLIPPFPSQTSLLQQAPTLLPPLPTNNTNFFYTTAAASASSSMVNGIPPSPSHVPPLNYFPIHPLSNPNLPHFSKFPNQLLHYITSEFQPQLSYPSSNLPLLFLPHKISHLYTL